MSAIPSRDVFVGRFCTERLNKNQLDALNADTCKTSLRKITGIFANTVTQPEGAQKFEKLWKLRQTYYHTMSPDQKECCDDNLQGLSEKLYLEHVKGASREMAFKSMPAPHVIVRGLDVPVEEIEEKLNRDGAVTITEDKQIKDYVQGEDRDLLKLRYAFSDEQEKILWVCLPDMKFQLDTMSATNTRRGDQWVRLDEGAHTIYHNGKLVCTINVHRK